MFTATTSLIASHGDDWGHGPGPGPWFPLVIVLFWVAVGAVVVWQLRRACGAPRSRADGQSVLAELFARGDISAEDYRERRDVLKEQAR